MAVRARPALRPFRSPRLARWGLATLLLVLACACSDDPSGGGKVVTDAGNGFGGGTFDGGLGDLLGNGKPLDVKGTPDVPDLDAVTASCEFPADPQPGQPGAPCASAADCDNNQCVEGPEGKICTVQCVSCCPQGYKCLQNLTGGDSAFLCQPQMLALCYPCKTDAECGAINQGSLCVGYGEGGRFCGGTCAKDVDCPVGYQCQDAQGSDGVGKQCIRTEGPCGCSPKAKEAGAETVCSTSNSHGTCGGTRKCGLDSLSACSAATPAAEICNGSDDDCDGQTDEDAPDTDGDGTADCQDDDQDGDGTKNEEDCKPLDKTVHPGAEEVCDGIDQDCDGQTDEGFDDTDGDGQADCVDDDDDGDGVPDDKDCAPTDKNVSPSAKEACNGKDDNCNGKTDEGFPDADGDGQADCLDDDSDGDGVPNAEDCAPNDKNVSPKAQEACNGKDDDCDGEVDEEGAKGCQAWFEDKDGDGLGGNVQKCLCKPAGDFTAPGGGDCDDGKASVAPGQAEVCGNGQDDDCDAQIDEADGTKGCVSFWQDADGDGWGAGAAKCQCGPSGVFSAKKTGDCNDTDPKVSPSGTEVCNGKDDTCDGQIDEEGATGCTTWYADADKDGYGSASKSACLCKASPAYPTVTGGDCDDLKKTVNPGMAEVCGGGDEDCDGKVDEAGASGCKAWYSDDDGDGYGNAGNPACQCGASTSHPTQTGGDCNDGSAAVKPGAKELCNGINDDCDASTDEGYALGGSCTAGSGGCQQTGKYVCSADGLSTTCSATGGAGKTEACNDLDDDCDGQVDEGCDDDGDGYCDSNLTFIKSAKCSKGGGDCNDGNASVKPGASEVCNNADDNCDGKVDGNTQPCSTACGTGTETCTAGVWKGCTAATPKCTSGPCCDGCNFRPSTYKCGTTPYSTTKKCSGTCGGDVIQDEQWAYCTGASSTCGTSNLKTVSKGVVDDCTASELCSASGTTASCKACANGCAAGQCKTQPVYTICIDPGYGGSEPGAVYNGMIEKYVDLNFAMHLKDWLEKDAANPSGGGNWKVVMTRTTDTTVSIATRASICNSAGAHRALSIFVNDIAGPTSVNGTETYKKTTADATTSNYCAKVQAQVVSHGKTYNRGVKSLNYTILTSVNAPACLTLPGFIKNPGDHAKLADDAWRKEVAKGLMHAIQESFGYTEFTP